MSLRSQPVTRGNPGQVVPHLEVLEDRCTPSCTLIVTRGAAQDGRDLMTVTGTTQSDRIYINDSGARGRGSVVVDTFDGQDRVVGGADADIGEVRVSSLYGADDVRYYLTGNFSTSRLVSVDLGDSDDKFAAYFTQYLSFSPGFGEGAVTNPYPFGFDFLQGSNLDLRVLGGPGRDSINILANHNVDLYRSADNTRNAIMSLSLNGGSGNDTIGVYYDGILNGMLGFIADGGANDDTVTAHINVHPGSTGTLGDPIRSQLRDGGGQDSLTYLLADHSHGGAQLFASMAFTDWGPFDEANIMGNVRVIW